jgi:hypothetical protein
MLMLMLCTVLGSHTAHAQLDPSNDDFFVTYDIESGGKIVGYVVVVDAQSTNHPAGYTPGMEHWMWTGGPVWAGDFKLVASDTAPAYDCCTWQTHPHADFDLEKVVPFPEVAPNFGDRFYKVDREISGEDALVGYLWLQRGSTNVACWYETETHHEEVLNPDTTTLRFTAVKPPKEGDTRVFLLQGAHSDCPG